MSKADPDAVNPAVRTRQDLKPQPVLLHNFARQRNMPGNLRHKATQCSGLVMLRQTQGSRIIARIAEIVLFR